MANMFKISLAVLILQIYVNAAPSDISKLEDVAYYKKSDEKRIEEPYLLEEQVKDDSNTTVQGQRQKRFYNYYGYGFPPISPVVYPNYVKRDESPYIGNYGAEDPFTQIYRRLQEIAEVIRQPTLPPQLPPQSSFPIFFPVIYVPQIGCGCIPGNQNMPDQNPVNPNPTNNINGSLPDFDISNRWPVMEDERQNWGFVVNETEVDDGQEEDFTRPIAFDPIVPNRTTTGPTPPAQVSDGQEDDFTRPISFEPVGPNRPVSRPAPPVEHGSSQAGASPQDQLTTTTTIRSNDIGLSTSRSSSGSPPTTAPVDIPSVCDGAVLSCCHQVQVTYDCFAAQGCPDPTSYGNPCEPQVILRVIDRFQRFYGQRTG